MTGRNERRRGVERGAGEVGWRRRRHWPGDRTGVEVEEGGEWRDEDGGGEGGEGEDEFL